MQDKTQVFPLASNDYVRTRLTHTIEVASVGRSLGNIIGEWVKTAKEPGTDVDAAAFAEVTAAACIAHDIGNPPFGHSGENAIQTWFVNSPIGKDIRQAMTKNEALDFEHFEGNAQAFRVISRLEYGGKGLGLTCGTLATFSKYPRSSETGKYPTRTYFKKHGYHCADRQNFEEVAKQTGLIKGEIDGAFCRHPLAYLVEAADDICYRIVDIEDAVVEKAIDFEEAKDCLLALFDTSEKKKIQTRLDELSTRKAKLELLRAKSINVAIFAVCEVFKSSYDELMQGVFEVDLVAKSTVATAFDGLKKVAKEKVYKKRSIVSIEVAGYEILGGLLDAFAGAGHRVASGQHSRRDDLVLNLLSERIPGLLQEEEKGAYGRLLKITDYVSGMTDSFALELFSRIKGISVTDGGRF
jgi:dGTPase